MRVERTHERYGRRVLDCEMRVGWKLLRKRGGERVVEDAIEVDGERMGG